MILGEYKGWLEVVDIKTYNVTSTHKFIEGDDIYDIIAIDETHYLIADSLGLLKTTKDQLINHNY